MRLFLVCILFFISVAGQVRAQVNMNELYQPFPKDQVRRNPIRVFLNHFTISASTGYNYNMYTAKLHNFDAVKIGDQFYLAQLPDSVNPNSFYNIVTNWINQPQAFSDTLWQTDGFMHSDTNRIAFYGYSNGIPLNLSLQYNIWRFRVGGGASFEYLRPAKMYYQFENEARRPYQTNFKGAFHQRYYGHLSFKIRDFWDYTFWADLQVGVIRRGKQFDANIQNSLVIVNLGAPIEYNFSEYFRLSARPFVEFKNYTSNLTDIGESIKVSNPTFGLQLGISYNYPEVGRCPIDNCEVQLKHIHKGKEYRGQPITKKQNPKVGENHRKLFKYKGKNKRMLNPY